MDANNRQQISITAAPATGAICPGCDGGHLVVYTSKRRGALCVQYFECWKCKRKPENNKLVVPADAVPIRRPRKPA